MNCSLGFLFLADRSGTRCGLLLQGSTCCVFRDGVLRTFVVTSGYMSYCCLSIISNQSAHSPLTSDINKAFSSTQLPLTGYFLFFRIILCKHLRGLCVKIQVDQQFLKYSVQPVCHQQPFHVQSHLNPLFPHSDARFEIQQVVFTTSKCLNACDWLISNLLHQVIEQVYLIKRPVSVYTYIHTYIHTYKLVLSKLTQIHFFRD